MIDDTVEPEATPEIPAPVVAKNSVSTDPDAPAKKKRAHKSAPGQVVGKDKTDTVAVSRLVFGARARKSLSVHHLQRRLNDLGYPEAYADQDGWAGPLTERSVSQWQKDNGYPVGKITGAQATALFEGDPNVTVLLDTMD